jgi:hypothetical protein
MNQHKIFFHSYENTFDEELVKGKVKLSLCLIKNKTEDWRCAAHILNFCTNTDEGSGLYPDCSTPPPREINAGTYLAGGCVDPISSLERVAKRIIPASVKYQTPIIQSMFLSLHCRKKLWLLKKWLQ